MQNRLFRQNVLALLCVVGTIVVVPLQLMAEDILVKIQVIRPDIGSDAKLSPEKLDEWRLEVSVTNHTSAEIKVPGEYDGQVLQIYAKSPEHRYPLHLYSVKRIDVVKDQRKITAGDRAMVATFLLKDILVKYDSQKERAYLWDWRARPKGPPSPLHLYREEGYVSSMTFWAELHDGERVYRSTPDIITVEQPSEEPVDQAPKTD